MRGIGIIPPEKKLEITARIVVAPHAASTRNKKIYTYMEIAVARIKDNNKLIMLKIKPVHVAGRLKPYGAGIRNATAKTGKKRSATAAILCAISLPNQKPYNS